MAGYAAFTYTYPTQPSTSKRQHKQTSTVVTFTQRNLAVTQHEIEDTLIPHVFLEIHPHKKGRPSIYVLNAYSSPKDSSKQAAALIHKAAILAGAAPLLIAGDFNARHQAWGYPRSLPKGVAIWNTLQTEHLTLITDPDYPTREENSVSPDTTRDLSITRNIPLATWSNTRNTLGSDHSILEITIPDNTHKRRETPEKRLVNWDHFRALREEEGEAVDLGSWTRSLQDNVRQATDTIPATSPEGRADAELLHMWQALERLRARWSKQKRNRSLRKRISRLERDIETYAIELDSQHWGQICDQINGKLGLRDTWGLLRHLTDPQGSKTVQRNTLTKVASTFPGDARALIEALKDKNMNPTFHIQRRKARAQALHKLYAGRPDVYFVDAANYSEHRDRYALAVVVRSVELGAWSVELGAWSLERGARSVELGAWSVELGAWSVELGASSLERGARSVELGAWSSERGARSVELGAWSVELGAWSLERGARSVELGAWSVELGAWSLERGARSVELGAWSLERGARSVELGAWS
ncbi:amine oxidase [flavin-containing] B [Ixodes scapularis]